MYRIVFRTRDKVNAVHRLPRPFGLYKLCIIKLAFRSLVAALDGFPYTIHVIADDISEDLRRFLQAYPVALTEGTFGNESSIRASLAKATSFEDGEWVYLVEDDYLHTPEAFLWIDELIQHRDEILLTRPPNAFKRLLLAELRRRPSRQPLMIHPPDYPDRYWAEDRKLALLFASRHCHWRQVVNTTFTVLADAKTFRRFAPAFERSASGANDSYLSRKVHGRTLFAGKALCVSPIPGVATHLHEGVMTPVVDWAMVRNQVNHSD